MTKNAVVYARSGTVYVLPSSKSVAGVWIDQELTAAVSEDCEASDLGAALLRALAASRTGIPHPRSSAVLNDEILRVSRLKSWATFERLAKCVVAEEADGIRLTPTRNAGRNGFINIEEGVECLTHGATQEEVGQALRRALALAK